MTFYDLRKQANLTQAEIASSVNVAQCTVSVWESGINPPLKKYRRQLALLFGVTPEELSEAISNTLEENKWRRSPTTR